MTTYTEEEKQSAIRSIVKQRRYNQEHEEETAEYMRQYNQGHGEEIAEYNRRHNLEHREEKVEYNRQYNQEHREERLELNLRYNQEHKEEIADYNRQYNQEHREEIAEYRREHREEIAEHSLQYQREHPEVHKAAYHKRRALLVGSDGHFTAEEFRLLCEAYEDKCIYCHEELPLTPDHSIPLSRGGSNSIENIVPACLSCNKRKSTMTYDEFMERLLTEEVVRIT